MLFFASPSSCAGFVISHLMKSSAIAACLLPFGIATTSPPTNAEACPGLTPGRTAMPKSRPGNVVLEIGDQESAGALDADFASLEVGNEIGAVVGLCTLRDQPFRP